DAALRVDHAEVGFLYLADHAVGGCRPTIGHDVADLDFCIGGSGIIGLLRVRAAAKRGEKARHKKSGSAVAKEPHGHSPEKMVVSANDSDSYHDKICQDRSNVANVTSTLAR